MTAVQVAHAKRAELLRVLEGAFPEIVDADHVLGVVPGKEDLRIFPCVSKGLASVHAFEQRISFELPSRGCSVSDDTGRMVPTYHVAPLSDGLCLSACFLRDLAGLA